MPNFKLSAIEDGFDASTSVREGQHTSATPLYYQSTQMSVEHMPVPYPLGHWGIILVEKTISLVVHSVLIQ